MAGIDQLKVVFADLRDVINVGYKLLHHGGIFALYPLVQDFSSLSGLNPQELKAELVDLQPDERAQLLNIVNGIDVADPQVKAKIQLVFSDLNDAVDLGIEGVAVYNHVKAYLDKVKSTFA